MKFHKDTVNRLRQIDVLMTKEAYIIESYETCINESIKRVRLLKEEVAFLQTVHQGMQGTTG